MDLTKKPKKDRLSSLDLLRLLAALAVVLFHYLFRGAAGSPYLDHGYPGAAPFAIYGYLGVNLFFLISGFVIAWSAEGRTWPQFAVARFARLYPGFLVCMTATFVVQRLAGDARYPVGIVDYIANLSMFAPGLGKPFMDGVYWSIVLEVIFYGWIALALFCGVFERWKLAIVTIWLIVCALNEFFLKSGAVRLLFITEYAPFFATGILAQHLVAKGRSIETLALLACAFVLSCDTLTVTRQWMLVHYGVAVPMIGLVGANVVMHALFVASIRLRHLVAPSRLALMLGGLTYPLYLLHEDIGYIALNRLSPMLGRWSAFALVLAGVLAVSYAVWRFIETPVRKPLIAAILPWVERLSAPAARIILVRKS